MTSSKNQPDPFDPKELLKPFAGLKFQEEIGAELQDADGQFLSKGVAVFYRDGTAEFLPHDKADVNTLQSRAGILFLTKEKKSIKVSYKARPEAHPLGQRISIPLVLS